MKAFYISLYIGVKVELLPSTTETVFAVGEIINHTVGVDLTSIANNDWFTNVQRYPGPEYTDTEVGQGMQKYLIPSFVKIIIL